jgi:hypothetical protein
MSERVGNVSRTRYEQLVAEARELVAQVAQAQFALGDKALEITAAARSGLPDQDGRPTGEVAPP